MIDSIVNRTFMELKKNLPYLLSLLLLVALKLTWDTGHENNWSLEQLVAISLTGLVLTFNSLSTSDKVAVSISFLVIAFAPLIGASLSFGILLATTFMLERSRENILIGSAMLLSLIETGLRASGIFNMDATYAHSYFLLCAIAIFLMALHCIERPSILYTLMILAGTPALKIDPSGPIFLWSLGILTALFSLRYGLERMLAIFVIIYGLASGNIISMFLGVSALVIYDYSKKKALRQHLVELIPAILILVMAEGERNLALFFLLLLILNTISGSRIRSCLTKQHS